MSGGWLALAFVVGMLMAYLSVVVALAIVEVTRTDKEISE